VREGLGRLAAAKASGPPLDDPHDEAQLATFEEHARVSLGELELHRRSQDGECLVGLAPESRRWAMAMMSPAGPGEPEGPSWYHITTFDPTYGRYTWGKLEILDLRERARTACGAGFSLRRFHTAMLSLGSPPLGLLGTAVERG
jgi:Bacterial protein of unknown function (DUF885)